MDKTEIIKRINEILNRVIPNSTKYSRFGLCSGISKKDNLLWFVTLKIYDIKNENYSISLEIENSQNKDFEVIALFSYNFNTNGIYNFTNMYDDEEIDNLYDLLNHYFKNLIF